MVFNGDKEEIDANIQITNGTAVTVILAFYCSSASNNTRAHQLLKDDAIALFDPRRPVMRKNKSFTIVHIQNSTRASFQQTAVGQRQPADQLIYFRSKNAKNMNKFAETDFDFAPDQNQTISCVTFSFNVSIGYLIFLGRNYFESTFFPVSNRSGLFE